MIRTRCFLALRDAVVKCGRSFRRCFLARLLTRGFVFSDYTLFLCFNLIHFHFKWCDPERLNWWYERLKLNMLTTRFTHNQYMFSLSLSHPVCVWCLTDSIYSDICSVCGFELMSCVIWIICDNAHNAQFLIMCLCISKDSAMLLEDKNKLVFFISREISWDQIYIILKKMCLCSYWNQEKINPLSVRLMRVFCSGI